MKPLQLHVDVPGPPADVFAYFTDLGTAAERISGIRELTLLTDGAVGAGTRYRVARSVLGRQFTEQVELTLWEPSVRYCAECEAGGTRYTLDVSFRALGAEGTETDGTRVELELRAVPLTFAARLLDTVSGVTSGVARKCLQQDFDDLKAGYVAQHNSAGA